MRFSVAVPRLKKIQPSSRLCKYRRLRRPGGLRREYKKLRSLLPGATRSRQLRKKVGVVEAAYQYICELQTALLDKFSTKGVPEELAGVVRGKVATASDIQALALHLINNSASASNTLMRSPFVSVASLLPSRLLSSASELETSSSASTSRIHSLPDSAESTPSPSTHRLNNTLSDLASASEMESTPASNSRLECVSSEAASKLNDAASTSTETNKQHCERLSTTRSLEVSCSSSSDDIVSHAFSHSQPTATPKCITLSSSLQSAMNSILPSPASHSSTSNSSLFACNPSSSSTSKLIE